MIFKILYSLVTVVHFSIEIWSIFQVISTVVERSLQKRERCQDIHMKILFWKGDKLRIYFKRMERGTYEHPYDGPDYRISFEKLILILHGTSTQKKRYKQPE